MVVNDFIPKEIIDAFGWTFVHSIWEGLLLIVLLATLLVGLRRFSSSTKYLICVTFLFLFLASSTVTFYLVYHPVIPKVPIRQVYEERSDVSTIDEDPLIGDKHQDINQAFVPDFEMSLYAQFARFFPTITTIWFLGIILLSIRLLGSWMYLHRLKKQQVRKIGSNWEQRCKQLAKKIRLSKKYILRLSDAVSTPLVIGFFKPVILLPVKAITGLPEKQIEAILAHELAHIKRNDYLINIYQSVMEVIFFYHPVVWMISGRIRKERENCCDDLAISITKHTISYAEALVNLGLLENQHKLALALSGNNANLKARVQRMFTQRALIADFKERLITIVVVLLGICSVGLAMLIQPEANQNTDQVLPTVSVEKIGSQLEENEAHFPKVERSGMDIPRPLFRRTPDISSQKNEQPVSVKTTYKDPQPKAHNNSSNIDASELFKAVDKGNIDKVKNLLSSGAPVNAKDRNGRTPLFLAVKHNNYEVARLLVSNGGDAHMVDAEGRSILMEAADEDDQRLTELLVKEGVSINYQTDQEPSALFEAIENENIEVIKVLIKEGVDLEQRDKKGRTPLLYAVDEGKVQIAYLLIESGANVNASNENGWTVLMEAALSEPSDLVEALLSLGVDVNALSYSNHSALNGAVRREKLENAKLLIEYGANVNWKYDGFTPLSEAVRRNNYLMTKLLLENGADPKIGESSKGETPLIMAGDEKDPRIVELLIEKGAPVNGPRYDGRTALYEAIESGSIANAKILVEHGANVNWDKFDDLTPLMYAIERKKLNMVVLLVENGADIHAKRINGWSVVQIAEKTGHSEIINYLSLQTDN